MRFPVREKEYMFDDFDRWGGAIAGRAVYVKECQGGKIIPKWRATPFCKGIHNGKLAYYYYERKAGKPKTDKETWIPSTWDEYTKITK